MPFYASVADHPPLTFTKERYIFDLKNLGNKKNVRKLEFANPSKQPIEVRDIHNPNKDVFKVKLQKKRTIEPGQSREVASLTLLNTKALAP